MVNFDLLSTVPGSGWRVTTPAPKPLRALALKNGLTLSFSFFFFLLMFLFLFSHEKGSTKPHLCMFTVIPLLFLFSQWLPSFWIWFNERPAKLGLNSAGHPAFDLHAMNCVCHWSQSSISFMSLNINISIALSGNRVMIHHNLSKIF